MIVIVKVMVYIFVSDVALHIHNQNNKIIVTGVNTWLKVSRFDMSSLVQNPNFGIFSPIC